ncbi:MAG: hypothetical protein WA324_19605 [Bryobacteraceae bacterium]
MTYCEWQALRDRSSGWSRVTKHYNYAVPAESLTSVCMSGVLPYPRTGQGKFIGVYFPDVGTTLQGAKNPLE